MDRILTSYFRNARVMRNRILEQSDKNMIMLKCSLLLVPSFLFSSKYSQIYGSSKLRTLSAGPCPFALKFEFPAVARQVARFLIFATFLQFVSRYFSCDTFQMISLQNVIVVRMIRHWFASIFGTFLIDRP